MSSPFDVYPRAPRGEQKAPGVTPCRYAGVVGAGFLVVGPGVGRRVVGAVVGAGATGAAVVEGGAVEAGALEAAVGLGDGELPLTGPTPTLTVTEACGCGVARLPLVSVAAIVVPPQHSTRNPPTRPRMSGNLDFRATGAVLKAFTLQN